MPLSSERLHVGIYFGYANVYLYDFSSQNHYELAHSGRVMKLYDRQFCTYGLPVAYAAGRGGRVTRLDAASGRELWRVSLDIQLSGGVGSDGQTVAVGNEKGEVVALDANSGKLRCRPAA